MADAIADKSFDLLRPIVEPALLAKDIDVLNELYRHLPQGYWHSEVVASLRKLHPNEDLRDVIRGILRSAPDNAVLSRRKRSIVTRVKKLDRKWERLGRKQDRLLEMIVEPVLLAKDVDKLTDFFPLMPPGGWRAHVRGVLRILTGVEPVKNN